MENSELRKLTPAEQNFMSALYTVEYKRLYKYAERMLNGSLMAEDLVQDTILIACNKIDKLITHPEPGAWLMKSLQKNINNYWRVRDNLTKLIIDIPMEKWINRYPAKNWLEDELDLLYGDLATSEEYKIIKKFAVYGYSQKEIAAEYGISINTCKQRIYRAKKILQDLAGR